MKRRGDSFMGMVVLQVDDSVVIGINEFLEEEDLAARKLPIKGISLIKEGFKEVFNGLEIRNLHVEIFLTQSSNIDKLLEVTSEEAFSRTTSLVQYIFVSFRADICAAVQLLSSGSHEIDESDKTELNIYVRHLKGSIYIGISF